MSIENALGTIQCDTTLEILDGVLVRCGVRARATAEPSYFSIVSGGRAVFPDPIVEKELMTLALVELEEAQRGGRIPSFSFWTASASPLGDSAERVSA